MHVHGPWASHLTLWAIYGLYTIYTNTPPQSELPGAAEFKTGQARRQTYIHTVYTPPPQSQLATDYVETGPKLREGRGGKTLGEDVRKLGVGRDMENPNVAHSHPVPNEV